MLVSPKVEDTAACVLLVVPPKRIIENNNLVIRRYIVGGRVKKDVCEIDEKVALFFSNFLYVCGLKYCDEI